MSLECALVMREMMMARMQMKLVETRIRMLSAPPLVLLVLSASLHPAFWSSVQLHLCTTSRQPRCG